MRCVVQRVKRASVTVNGELKGKIGMGLLVLWGIGQNDDEQDIKWMSDKIQGLRIFEDSEGKMNLSVSDIQGELLLVSQFTLYGDCRKGRRPSFSSAAPPELAQSLFERAVEEMRKSGLKIETGVFQAEMEVELLNHGPVTLLLDSEKKF